MEPPRGRGPGGLTLYWDDPFDPGPGDRDAKRPLAGLVKKMLTTPGADYGRAGQYPLELIREPGRYSEVETLVARACDLVEQGVAPDQIALVFPDLAIYGQMTVDVARRLNLPLERGPGLPLTQSPLVQAILCLLELGMGDMPRSELGARVLDSPYLTEPLARWLLGPQAQPFADPAEMLRQAGYIDAREGGIEDMFERAAAARPERESEFKALGQAVAKLKSNLTISGQYIGFKDYLEHIDKLLASLEPLPLAQEAAQDAPLQVRDLMAWSAFKEVLGQLAGAAGQISLGSTWSPGRCLALVRQAVSQKELSLGRNPRDGVRLMRLQDLAGVRLHSLLMGGLTQNGFPHPAPGTALYYQPPAHAPGRPGPDAGMAHRG